MEISLHDVTSFSDKEFILFGYFDPLCDNIEREGLGHGDGRPQNFFIPGISFNLSHQAAIQLDMLSHLSECLEIFSAAIEILHEATFGKFEFEPSSVNGIVCNDLFCLGKEFPVGKLMGTDIDSNSKISWQTNLEELLYVYAGSIQDPFTKRYDKTCLFCYGDKRSRRNRLFAGAYSA